LLSINGRESVLVIRQTLFSKQTKLTKTGFGSLLSIGSAGRTCGIRDVRCPERYVNGAEGERSIRSAHRRNALVLRTTTLAFRRDARRRKSSSMTLRTCVDCNLGCIELHPHPVRSGDLDSSR